MKIGELLARRIKTARYPIDMIAINKDYQTMLTVFRAHTFWIEFSKSMRVDVCGRCRAVVPFDCRFTRIHHESYSQENIKVKERFGNACCVARYRPRGLGDVIELCPKCHTEADAEMRRRRLLGALLCAQQL